MTTIDKLNKNKIPLVKIDKSLERLRGKNLFPEKLAKANEVIARVGLPKLAKQKAERPTFSRIADKPR